MSKLISSHPSEATLRAYAQGRLDSGASTVVSEHLKTCEPCRQKMPTMSPATCADATQDAPPRRHEATTAEPVWPSVLVGVIALPAVVLLLWFAHPPAPPTAPTRITTAWQGTQPGEVHVVRVQDQEIRFRWCPPGSFTMGSPRGEIDRFSNEDLVAVTLTKGFWMMETELTQGVWLAAGGNTLNGQTFGGSPDLPVCNVSHIESEAFAVKLTRLLHESGQLPPGMKLALPSEAQWEYAARAGTTTRFSFGDYESDLWEYAWYQGNSEGKVHAVGTRRENPWGLRDMAGNVWEWCADPYDEKLPGGVPRGPSGAPFRVLPRVGLWGEPVRSLEVWDDSADPEAPSIRGGGYGYRAEFCRSAFRFRFSPETRGDDWGLRLAAVPSDDPDPVVAEQPPAPAPDLQGTQAGDIHVVQVNGQEIRLRWCPPGSFTMGSPPGEKGGFSNEAQVNVTLTKGFWMMETELTQGVWLAAGGNTLNGQTFGGSPDLPVWNVSHIESEAFAVKLTRLLLESGQLPSGMKLALPTEAQWEYAARAGTTSRFFFGDDEKMLGEYAWYSDNARGVHAHGVHPVGQKQPNAWGLRDMAGNVWEWCADVYGEKLPGGVDPVGRKRGPVRVSRGGNWLNSARYCRSAYRSTDAPDYRNYDLGFRLAAVPSADPGVVVAEQPPAPSLTKAPATPPAPPSPPTRVTSSWQGTEAGEIHVVRVKDQEIRLRWCPPGSFTMGSPPGEKGRFSNEAQVNVTLTKGFWMLETEVTQGLWQAAGGPKLNWSSFGGSAGLPVYKVSHTESEAFAVKLTQLLHESGQLPTGMKLALPTEAQWEYAARAGTTTRFSFGDEESKLGEHAWYWDNAGSKVHPVGQKLPNPWGLHDMAGNVWEWCADGYGGNLPGGVDPVGPKGAPFRVRRGGGWDDYAWGCRSAFRNGYRPVNRYDILGFRLAAVPAEP